MIFLEVTLSDASEFSTELNVHGCFRQGRRVLEMTSPVVPNSIAALLLHLRDSYSVKPNVYFEWTEGNPGDATCCGSCSSGVGEIAPITREVLRRAEPDRCAAAQGARRLTLPHLQRLVRGARLAICRSNSGLRDSAHDVSALRAAAVITAAMNATQVRCVRWVRCARICSAA